MKKKVNFWTKKKIIQMIKEWDNYEGHALMASDLGVSKAQVSGLAIRLRKEGFKLTIRRGGGYLTSLIREMLDED